MFNPNRLPLAACVNRIQRASRKVGFDVNKRIVTSRDKVALKLRDSLRTSNIPNGFRKWQLPMTIEGAFMFISVAPPNAKVPEHAHKDGAGLRFIASGSVKYKGQELTEGDWMYIPKGKRYSFETGPLGATIFYCYAC
jgi:hypothetical protein